MSRSPGYTTPVQDAHTQPSLEQTFLSLSLQEGPLCVMNKKTTLKAKKLSQGLQATLG